MRILAIHANRISYKANRKAKFAEEIENKEDAMDDCLVLLSCVERLDQIDPGLVVETAKHSVIDRLGKLKANRVMIFPFAHLTSTLSTPDVAIAVLKSLETKLREAGIEVKRAPFGWYKEYDISSKGHPMAEMSMVICPYEGQSCDFHCPYCANPIELRDMKEIEAERSGSAKTGTVTGIPERF